MTYLDKNAQHGQTIGMTGRLRKGLIFGLIPVHQMQLSGKRSSINCVLAALVVCAAPVAVELLQYVLVLAEGTALQLGVLSVDIHPPAVARIDQAARVLGHILHFQGLSLQVAALGRRVRGDIDGRLAFAAGQREQLSPFLGTCKTRGWNGLINIVAVLRSSSNWIIIQICVYISNARDKVRQTTRLRLAKFKQRIIWALC